MRCCLIKCKYASETMQHRPGSSKLLDMAVMAEDDCTTVEVRGSECGHLDAFTLLPNGTIKLLWSNSLGTRVAQLQSLTLTDAAFPNGAVVAAAGSSIHFLDPFTGATLRTQETGFTDAILDLRINRKRHLHMCTRRMLFTTDLDGRELHCVECEASIVCFSIINTAAGTVALVGTSDKSIKLISEGRLLHDIKTPASPTSFLSNEDVQSIESISVVYGTNQGTIHAVLLKKADTGFEETEIFKIETASTASKTRMDLKPAEVSILMEGPIVSGGLSEFLSTRDDGLIQWYSASKVRRGVVPQLLSEKNLKTRVECLVWRSGFSEILALTQVGDVVGLKCVEADPEKMRVLLHETEANIERVLESKRVAPLSSKAIEPQAKHSVASDNITVKLQLDAQNACYFLAVDASNAIDSIALHTSSLMLRNLTAVPSEEGPSGVLSHQQRNSNERFISVATFIATRKLTRQSFTLVPYEGVLGTLHVFVTLAEPNVKCLQSVHEMKPFSFHERVGSADSNSSGSIEAMNQISVTADISMAAMHHWIHRLFPDIPEQMMHMELKSLNYTFQSLKGSSKVNCLISKGSLQIEANNLTTCYKLHKAVQQLAAEQLLNMNLKTRLQIPKSLDSHIYALFQILESNARDARTVLLVAGLKEVEAIQRESVAELLEGQLAAFWHDLELKTETGSRDDANEELAELYVSSYALRGVDVGAPKRESFARYLNNAGASAESTAFYPITFEELRKHFYNEI